MTKLWDLVPDANTLIALDPEELGGILLRVLWDENGDRHQTHFATLHDEIGASSPYPKELRDEIQAVVSEAFQWLLGQAFILPADPRHAGSGWVVLGKRGKRLANPANWEAYRKASTLPKALLHQKIADVIYFDFVRGDYSSAVLKSFREVEIAVREAAGLTDEAWGVDLVRSAFHKTNGPLTDHKAVVGEREALGHLFAGAIGTYKNPNSHRRPDFYDPVQAVEMIVLASHLMRIVEDRRKLKEMLA